MASSVTTSVTELPESRVRVDAEVPPEEIQRRVQQKARDLGRGLKVPGFRKGKVPPALVIQRIGRDAVLDEAIRDTLVDWYRDAIDVSGDHPDRRPQGRPRRSAGGRRGADLLDRDRGAPDGQARSVQG